MRWNKVIPSGISGQFHDRDWSSVTKSVAGPAVVGSAYFIGAQAGFGLRFPSSPISMLWPPNSILLCAFLLTPIRRWSAYLAAVVPAHFVVEFSGGVPLITTLGLYCTNIGQALLGAWGIRRFVPDVPFRLKTLQNVLIFLVMAVIAPLAIAFIASEIIVGTGWANDYWISWKAQFLSNVLTVVAIVPIGLSLVSMAAGRRVVAPRRFVEAGVVGIALVAVSYVVFSGQFHSREILPALLYAPLPLLIWTAIRFGPGGLSLSVLFVAAWVVRFGAEGKGPFGELDPATNVVSLQLYLIAVTFPLLVLSALVQERTQTTAALRETEQRYRSVVEAQSDLVCRFLPNTALTFVNEAFCRFFQQRREDLLGISFLALLPNSFQDEAKNLISRLLHTPDDVNFELELLTPREGLRTVHWDCHTIFGSDGSVLEVQCVGHDITERRRAEDALRDSEQRLQAILDNTSAVIYIKDLHGRYVLVNQSFESIWGHARHEVLGRTDRELMTGHNGDQFDAHDNRVVQTGLQLQFEESAIIAGEERTYLSTKFPLRTNEGRMYAICGISTDITERKRVENELREGEARLSEIADTVPNFIILFDVDSRITFVNRAFAEFHGVSEDHVQDIDLLSTVHPDDRPYASKLFNSGVAERRVFSIEYRKRRIDGEYRWLYNHLVPRFEPDDTFLGYIAAVTDVTERKEAETALRELSSQLLRAQDAERRRISRELHDVTAQEFFAMTVELGRLSNMFPDLPAEAQQILLRARALGETALRTLRTQAYLLHPPLLDELGLAAALEWYLDGFSQRSGIRVELAVDESIVRLPEDIEFTLYRIVQESVTNVLRHAHSPTAQVRLTREDRSLVLRITDQGRGERVDGDEQASFGSWKPGVGLTGMRERVRHIGGSLEIDAHEAGATITVRVPLIEP